jgi:hypothetical protein
MEEATVRKEGREEVREERERGKKGREEIMCMWSSIAIETLQTLLRILRWETNLDLLYWVRASTAKGVIQRKEEGEDYWRR